MNRGGRAGFTIIEVIIFVAISGALILIAMSTIGSKQHRVQFTDSMRSLESFFEVQRAATRNGVNDNPSSCESTGGDSGDCVTLGRVIIFGLDNNTDPMKYEYRVLTGDRLSADDESSCAYLLECADPTVENYAREDDFVWGSQFVVGYHNLGTLDEEPSRAFGFVRDPRSAEVNLITYSDIGSGMVERTINDDATYGAEDPMATFGPEVSAYYCFTSSTRSINAVFVLKGSSIELIFDPVKGGDYDCAS